MTGGRVFVHRVTAKANALADGRIELCAPLVGMLRDAASPGTSVQPGQRIGVIEVLGVQHELLADARGVVAGEPRRVKDARARVEYGQVLLVLEQRELTEAAVTGASDEKSAAGGLVFRAPSPGRFYLRPAPDKPPFIKVGDVIEAGTTVALLEVMKTFHRISYGAPGLPERARVTDILPQDGDDLDEGDPLLSLAEAD
jgi:acetyl-CoA carboxylase biotin carboxyl carrier protein